MDTHSDLECTPVLAELVYEGRPVGRSGRIFEDAAALSTRNNIIVLRRLMMNLKMERTLEVGLCFGGSCLALAASHRDLGRPPARQHVALDPFQASVWEDAGLFAMERAGLRGYVDFRQSPSSVVLPELLQQGLRFDLIYIDGSHLFEDVFVDAYFAVRLAREEGGVVLFDDCRDPNISKVLAFLRANLSEELREMDLSPFRADPGLSLRYRLAVALRRQQLRAFRRVGNPERSWNAPFRRF